VGELAGIELDVRRLERAAESAGELARRASAAETAAICARTLIPVRPPAPLPDKLHAEVDGTGVAVRPAETTGRAGKGEDGQAGTREVKIGRIFTQSGLDARDRPAIDTGSSGYVHTFDGIETFTGQFRAEFIRRDRHCRPPLPQAIGHALDRGGRRQHHRAALPARQRPLGPAMAPPGHRHHIASVTPRDKLNDHDTQNPR
jgi:hypothetical protein